MKSYILPVGFNFNPQPDPDKRCDSPSCHELSESTWKLFEGCWHSFHSSCLDEPDTCFICKDGLQKNLQSLAKTANETFVQRSQEDPNDDFQEDADVTEEGNTNTDDDHEIHVVGEVNVDEILQHLTRQIFSLQVQQPSANRPAVNQNRSTSQPTSAQRPPHCSLCGHKRQGYHKQASVTGKGL